MCNCCLCATDSRRRLKDIALIYDSKKLFINEVERLCNVIECVEIFLVE